MILLLKFDCFFWFFCLVFSVFKRNEEMRAMEVLPILKEKVAFLSGKCLSIIIKMFNYDLLNMCCKNSILRRLLDE